MRAMMSNLALIITGLLGRRAARRPSVARAARSRGGKVEGLRPRRWCAGGLLWS